MNQKARKSEVVKSYSGGYGFVAFPDKSTIEKCYAFARDNFPKDCEYILAPPYLPHITLYHSRMKEVPIEFASQIKGKLTQSLKGLTFNLSSLECFGAKFIFWNIEPFGSSYETILKCHKEALSLAFYLDRTATKRATEEGLTLTDQERENVELFNHPLVRDLYTPHITLAYDQRAPEFFKFGTTEKFSMTIESVEFAEIGHPGVVVNIIEL